MFRKAGDLILNNGEILKINTSAPSIDCVPSCSYNLKLQNRSSQHGSHLVANIAFSGNIEFRSGSTVKVFGKYALSITSQNGNITIQTDVTMTCGEDLLDTTCLGGFTQNSTEVTDLNSLINVYQGLGPGGLKIINTVFRASTQCIPGSSHGGKAQSGNKFFFESPQTYDKNDTKSLLGGSGGSCLVSPGSVAGGGAIELVAEKGQITIDASIKASAQTDNSKICSGGSGGLIRLKARKVVILDNGRLIVDGAEGRHSSNPQYKLLGGGAGGIIQIIASEGSIAAGTLSIKHGDSSGRPICSDAENGSFLLKANESSAPANYFNLAESYSWPPRYSISTSSVSILTTKPHTSSATIHLESSVAPTTSGKPTIYPQSSVAPTTSGSCAIEPSEGQSLNTTFNITCFGWNSSHSPLRYEFLYTLQNGLRGVLYQGSEGVYRTVLISTISVIEALVIDVNGNTKEVKLNVSVHSPSEQTCKELISKIKSYNNITDERLAALVALESLSSRDDNLERCPQVGFCGSQ
ncbi:hypothetical protein OS493_034891 [Desmophyllum pertusum]|uniref:PKD/REJ-like domain-containing protein n=1 Tax=Desmophyllum pertusum TaxID=174260 RepID=A0A9X0D2I1_9CNID|nr:hypothetical protein OS493_034891 [Desmophyllum pertusum]